MYNPVNEVIERAIAIAGSQYELAKRIGVNQSTVSKWLNGAEVSSRFIRAIATATGGVISDADILDSVARSKNEP